MLVYPSSNHGLIGYRSSSTCGYCRRRAPQTGQSWKRHSFYVRASSMSPTFYQSLIDRSWRRSGKLLYRPNQRDSCCPHYTLRLDSSQVQLAKDQRAAINRFNKYILGDDYIRQSARLYPRSREESKKRDREFDLVERIHEAEVASLKTPPKPAHRFEVTLESDDFTEEKYAVFENYQRIVHQESTSDISRDGFKRFLCDSPLRNEVFRSTNGDERPVGSFHQCYRLDGKLVAVGVLDLLPQCVSAKYFLYHESIHKFQPGKLGALYEIALAAEKGYRYWYSGFYIHTCPKMRYKIDFKPQYVLDPDHHVWLPLDKEALKLFDEKGYLHLPSAPPQLHSNIDPRTENTPIEVGDSHAMDENDDAEDDDDGDDDDDDDDKPLLASNMPGLPSLDVLQRIPLDIIPVRLKYGMLSAGDVFQWEDEDITDAKTAKGMIAELVAATGPDLMLQWALDFRR
ncbi:arginine-tRNA-protein transferase [Truncatella angustata]|uniref:arginyltransferase n=1 Tax=Truncatella angustata TaxID=152316 RepID=A0A9P8RGW5_9PEZI|nr:arginine-tRNA-protein transferase [Truncatella angustata]KAH6645803.1 arginine-tRNA-protein transferase [Truncatella angustata]